MKWIGMIFVVISTGVIGLQFASSMKQRCKLVRQLLSTLQILKNEIVFCGTPLAQAFAMGAVSANGVVEQVFSSVARKMDQHKWLTPFAAMEQTLQELPNGVLENEVVDILKSLSSGLGKYDQDSQIQTLTCAKERLEHVLTEMEKERSIRGKTYEILGICAGLSIVILLI